MPRSLFVGEQPGDQEDRQGRPFVGPAGQLLTRRWRRPGSTAKRLPHQCGQAFQVRAARQAADPPASPPPARSSIPLVADEGTGARAAPARGGARRDGGAGPDGKATPSRAPGARPRVRPTGGLHHGAPVLSAAARRRGDEAGGLRGLPGGSAPIRDLAAVDLAKADPDTGELPLAAE